MDSAALAMSVSAMIILTLLPVPMLMNVLMAMTICAMRLLTVSLPQVVTSAYARLHTGKAMAWTETIEVLDVLPFKNVPLKLTTVFLSTVPMKIVSPQVHLNVSITTKVSLVIVQLLYGPTKVECDDIDKCDPNDRKGGVNADYFNDVGSHSCQWIRQLPMDTTDGGTNCFDVDEYTFTGDDAVCDNATCNDIDGSFECTCLVGYSGTPCIDNNEYQDGTNNCAENAVCANIDGSFTCTCNPGF